VAFNPFTGNSRSSSQITQTDACQTGEDCGGVNGEVLTKILDDMLTKDILPLCDNTQPECQDLKTELTTREPAENIAENTDSYMNLKVVPNTKITKKVAQ
jgi:hypothetical protein